MEVRIPSSEPKKALVLFKQFCKAICKAKGIDITVDDITPAVVAIVGPSGSGKTYASRNLSPKNTLFFNVEAKPLPFRHGHKKFKGFQWYKDNEKSKETKELQELLKNVECIVFDSLTFYMNLNERGLDKAGVGGFEKWNEYGTFAEELLTIMNEYPIPVFMICHSKDSKEGLDILKSIKIKGSTDPEMFFTTILYSHKNAKDGSRIYYFSMNMENTTSKVPPDLVEIIENHPDTIELFGENSGVAPNDYKVIIDCINEFYKPLEEE
jgi:hypothetical protein